MFATGRWGIGAVFGNMTYYPQPAPGCRPPPESGQGRVGLSSAWASPLQIFWPAGPWLLRALCAALPRSTGHGLSVAVFPVPGQGPPIYSSRQGRGSCLPRCCSSEPAGFRISRLRTRDFRGCMLGLPPASFPTESKTPSPADLAWCRAKTPDRMRPFSRSYK